MPNPRLVPIFSVEAFPQRAFPLALGLIQAFGRRYAGGALLKKYRFVPFFNASLGFMEKIARSFGPGIWLFSNYLWSERDCLSVSQMVKRVDRRNITIHGGPSVPRYPEACRDFLRQHDHIDIAVLCEGEVAVSEILAVLDGLPDSLGEVAAGLQEIEGIAFLKKNGPGEREVIRTPHRVPVEDLDSLPSPFLTGVFDQSNFKPEVAVLETNRGCPYHCAYCCFDGVAGRRIRNFSLKRVFAEIEWLAKKKISFLMVADSNFGIFPRDLEIVQHIAQCKRDYGYPREVLTSSIYENMERMVEIVQVLVDAGISTQGIISLQTLDPETLSIIRRKNIPLDRLDTLIAKFRERHLPLMVELMVGLPGATMRSLKKDLQFCFDRFIAAKTIVTCLLANSPMAAPEFREKYDIQVDGDNYVQSCFSFSKDDLQHMHDLLRIFHLCESDGYLRYFLKFLQWDHAIPALKFMEALLSVDNCMGMTFEILPLMKDRERFLELVKDNLELFYREISCFTEERFGIQPDSAFATALRLNMSTIPDKNRTYPIKLNLSHDFVSYVMDNLQPGPGVRKKLCEYKEKEIEIIDPEEISTKRLNSVEVYKHQGFWEPDSILRDINLVPLSSDSQGR